MPKCAYCGNEISNDKIVTSCKNGCHRTNFLCSCGSANRTTAFYCRTCGKEISYKSALIRHTRNLKISSFTFEKALFELPLSELGISYDDLPRFFSSYGNLFLIFKTGKIIVLKSGSGEVQANIEISGEISTLPIEVSDRRSKSLFIMTSNEIYRIDLIRDFAYELITNIGERDIELNSQPLYIDGYFFLVVKQSSINHIKLISLDGDHKDIISLNDIISQPVKVEDKVFFYTKDRLFIYDHSKKEITYSDDNKYDFSTETEPKSSGNRIYALTNEERLYRINLDEDMPEVFGLPHPQLMQVCFEATENQVIIAHSKGVLVTNILGQIEWSSDDLLDLYPAYKFPPISYGDYIAFVMSYPNTEVLHIIEINNYKQVGSCLGNFVYRPMYCDGNLYTIVDENSEIIMRAYEL
ncbi:TPA: hypothetical protein ENX78_03215 [Candidatus Poribacteria bacterium]|nr:hypothetical protein [Candidatus Poribacteria bacterium]